MTPLYYTCTCSFIYTWVERIMEFTHWFTSITQSHLHFSRTEDHTDPDKQHSDLVPAFFWVLQTESPLLVTQCINISLEKFGLEKRDKKADAALSCHWIEMCTLHERFKLWRWFHLNINARTACLQRKDLSSQHVKYPTTVCFVFFACHAWPGLSVINYTTIKLAWMY